MKHEWKLAVEKLRWMTFVGDSGRQVVTVMRVVTKRRAGISLEAAGRRAGIEVAVRHAEKQSGVVDCGPRVKQ